MSCHFCPCLTDNLSYNKLSSLPHDLPKFIIVTVQNNNVAAVTTATTTTTTSSTITTSVGEFEGGSEFERGGDYPTGTLSSTSSGHSSDRWTEPLEESAESPPPPLPARSAQVSLHILSSLFSCLN